MKGTAVTQIQTALAALYYYPDKGPKQRDRRILRNEDGKCGETFSADVRFGSGRDIRTEDKSENVVPFEIKELLKFLYIFKIFKNNYPTAILVW